jgi:hypothetical protein
LKHSDEKFRRATVRRYRNGNVALFGFDRISKQTNMIFSIVRCNGLHADVHHNFDPTPSQLPAGSSTEEWVDARADARIWVLTFGCEILTLGAQSLSPLRRVS